MPNYGGNPWQAAANAYGSDLDQYNQIAMQGMNERANAPARLYQAFTQSYQAALDRQMQQAEMERRAQMEQARIDHMIRADEFNRERLLAQDERADKDRSAKFYQEVDQDFTGTPEEVKSYVSLANQIGIKGATDYFNSRKVAGTPARTENMAGEYPGEEGFTQEIPATPERYMRGTQYGLKADAANESIRKNTELEQIKLRQLAQAAKIAEEDRLARSGDKEADRDLRRTLAYAALGSAGDRRAAASEKEQYKRDMARREDEAALYSVDESLDRLKAGVERIKKSEGFEPAIGKSSFVRHIPFTPAADTNALINTLKSGLWMEAIGSLRGGRAGATGLGQITEPENKRIESLIETIDLGKMSAVEVKNALDRVVQWADSVKAKKQKMLEMKYGGQSEVQSSPGIPGGIGENELRRQANEAIKASPSNANAIRASFKAKTGKDL